MAKSTFRSRIGFVTRILCLVIWLPFFIGIFTGCSNNKVRIRARNGERKTINETLGFKLRSVRFVEVSPQAATHTSKGILGVYSSYSPKDKGYSMYEKLAQKEKIDLTKQISDRLFVMSNPTNNKEITAEVALDHFGISVHHGVSSNSNGGVSDSYYYKLSGVIDIGFYDSNGTIVHSFFLNTDGLNSNNVIGELTLLVLRNVYDLKMNYVAVEVKDVLTPSLHGILDSYKSNLSLINEYNTSYEDLLEYAIKYCYLSAGLDSTVTKQEFETQQSYESRLNERENILRNLPNIAKQTMEEAVKNAQTSIIEQQLTLNSKLKETPIQIEPEFRLYDTETGKLHIVIPLLDRDYYVPIELSRAAVIVPELRKNRSEISAVLSVNPHTLINIESFFIPDPTGGQAIVHHLNQANSPLPVMVASGTQSLQPPELCVSYSFREPSGNNMLDAQETGELELSISNSGKGSAYVLELSLNAGGARGISFPSTVHIGEIKAGATLKQSIALSASETVPDQVVDLKLRYKEQNGFPPDDRIITFQSKALSPPDLFVADVGIEDNNRNGRIEPGEWVKVTARIQNRGLGSAREVNAHVQLDPSQAYYVPGQSSSFDLGELKSGEFKDIIFEINTRRDAISLETKIDLQEQRPRFSKAAQDLNLALNRMERTAEQLIITGISQGETVPGVPSLSIDVRQNIPRRGKANPQRWGVIFGIESYQHVSPVSFARQDAEFMKSYFIETIGIPVENLYFQSCANASLSSFKTVFDAGGWLERNAAGSNNEIFIYYSGHGVPDPSGNKAYLLPYDGNPNYLENSAYELNQLFSNLQKLGARQITLFLDSCFSGANRERETLIAGARPVFVRTPNPQTAENMAVFSASRGDEISSSYPQMQHGLFSYFLMKGLGGEADLNKDNKITQTELQNYLAREVRPMAARLGREQNPQLQSSDASRILLSW